MKRTAAKTRAARARRAMPFPRAVALPLAALVVACSTATPPVPPKPHPADTGRVAITAPVPSPVEAARRVEEELERAGLVSWPDEAVPELAALAAEAPASSPEPAARHGGARLHSPSIAGLDRSALEILLVVEDLGLETVSSGLDARSRALLDQLAARARLGDETLLFEIQARGDERARRLARAVATHLRRAAGLESERIATVALAGSRPPGHGQPLETAGATSVTVLVLRAAPPP